MTLKIAVFQGESPGGATPAALSALTDATTSAAERGAGLIVFPELFLCGYDVGEAVFGAAETAGGPSAERSPGLPPGAGSRSCTGTRNATASGFTIPHS